MKTEKVTVTVPSIFGYEEVVVEAVGTIARVRKFPFEKVSLFEKWHAIPGTE